MYESYIWRKLRHGIGLPRAKKVADDDDRAALLKAAEAYERMAQWKSGPKVGTIFFLLAPAGASRSAAMPGQTVPLTGRIRGAWRLKQNHLI